MKSRSSRRCLSSSQLTKIQQSLGGRRTTCGPNDELCLVQQSGLSAEEKKKIEVSAFRPKMPSEWKKNMNTWLSDEDIRQVMTQYEEAYPEFEFLDVVPIDFSAPDPYAGGKTCIVKEFCDLNLKEKLKKGKRKIGAVFNLDPHYKNGSHWVGLFIDLDRKEVNYFDSYGIAPPPQVARFMRSLTLQDPSLVLNSNGRRFQYKGSECGIYSMYFILSLLTGDSFANFVKHPVNDDRVQTLRTFLYRA